MKVKSLSCVGLLVTPWTAAYQAPPSMGFARQEYWSGVPLSSIISSNVPLLIILLKPISFKFLSPSPFFYFPQYTFQKLDFLYLFMCLEKAMATHTSTLAWKIPWMEEPGGLQSMGSLRVGHN